MAVSLRILYVGDLWKGSTSLQRMVALEEAGHIITPIDTLPDYLKAKSNELLPRAMRKLFGPLDRVKANARLIKMIEEKKFDIVWIDKELTIRPETLKTIKGLQAGCVIAGYSPDDMNNRANQSKNFLRGLGLYDIYFTTKSYGVSELRDMGCRRVEFIANAYDPHTHRPVDVSDKDRDRFGGPVGFIGQWERERQDSILCLAQQGIRVRIWGPAWRKWEKHPNLRIEKRCLWADDYAKAICAFDINLCFLRKINRDLQTTRSIEIPACGGFMLAERTDEHLELFEEGKEAEFFGSDEELLDKVKYYLAHDEERERIACAGRERCLKSGYSYHDRLQNAISKIVNLLES